jgi:hypothetical protein
VCERVCVCVRERETECVCVCVLGGVEPTQAVLLCVEQLRVGACTAYKRLRTWRAREHVIPRQTHHLNPAKHRRIKPR